MAGSEALASTLGSGVLQNEYKFKFAAANGSHNTQIINIWAVALVALIAFAHNYSLD